MMRGARRAKTAVANFLATDLPDHLADLRVQWNVTVEQLPDPVDYLRNPPRALDKWPLIAVGAVRMPSLRRTEYLPNDTIGYSSTYGLRVFVWVRNEQWDPTIDMRDDLTAAVRSLLVMRPTLGIPQEECLVIEDSVVEDYSDVTKVTGDRFVAGAFVGFDLRVAEPLAFTLAGTVLSTDLSSATLPPHPAL